jgi:micrococcal nuclease
VSVAQVQATLGPFDTPESRTKDKMEKAFGLESKKRLEDILKDSKKVVIRTQKPDSTEKYGRILGWLHIDDQDLSVNEQMVRDGYAWDYMGDAKIKDFDLLIQKRNK